MFLVGDPNVRRSVKAGPLRKAVRVRAGLEQTGFSRTEACFLGGFVEDAGHRIASAVVVPSAWANWGYEIVDKLQAHFYENQKILFKYIFITEKIPSSNTFLLLKNYLFQMHFYQ